ncbi:M1 family metallopeptidase [Gilvibacter sediminis]|uniref:M1 family metallopeptidase n=1 Tax=Gilvibacter sediminis TaxID=379071 RepID=UPI00235021AF|nr:M1 family metallopeptidase [Gilvibacter sediminis]MDC7999016.1 M1 family metallopeptidase [Gilvibacter sediminis]
MKYRFLFLLLICSISFAQNYTRQDSLRGQITAERAWWDLQHYQLDVTVDIDNKSLSGSNTITYKVLENADRLQLDLQEPMRIDKVVQNGKELKWTSEGIAHYIQLQKKMKPGKEEKLTVYFSGKPRIAKNAPWDGGFVFTQDSNGKPFVANANQGIGASIWWPNKDHPYDEPDQGTVISVITPKDLMDVSNGRLIKVDSTATTKTWTWQVVNPINNYGININIGDYVHFGEDYAGEAGKLDIDYYVLRENEAKARKQFEQTTGMLEAFEHWFGPYPFYEDGFKLVEAPYLGMEHQSSVTYGNGYKNGFRGSDLSGTGWGLKFDFIIIHEAGHEWFANNITHSDVADLWVHEGFTNYSENLYLDYHFGTKAAADYVIGCRKNIYNDIPIIGDYGVRNEGSSDMYYKGANMLHNLRMLIEDDELWREILRGLNEDFRHQTVSSKQVEDYISKATGKDFSAFFNQYLRTTMIPNLELAIDGNQLKYRYTNIVDGFDMPVIMMLNDQEKWIFPNKDWQSEKWTDTINFVGVKRDFYVEPVMVED